MRVETNQYGEALKAFHPILKSKNNACLFSQDMVICGSDYRNSSALSLLNSCLVAISCLKTSEFKEMFKCDNLLPYISTFNGEFSVDFDSQKFVKMASDRTSVVVPSTLVNEDGVLQEVDELKVFMTKSAFYRLPKGFSQAVGKSIDFTSLDEARPIMTGVHIYNKDQHLFVEGTDGRELVIFDLGTYDRDIDVVIGKDMAHIISDLDLDSFAMHNDRIMFKKNKPTEDKQNIFYSAKNLQSFNQQYPNTRMIDWHSSESKIYFIEEFERGLERAALINNKEVLLNIEGKVCCILAKKNGVEFKTHIFIEAEDLEVPIRPLGLLKCLRLSEKAEDSYFLVSAENSWTYQRNGISMAFMPLRTTVEYYS